MQIDKTHKSLSTAFLLALTSASPVCTCNVLRGVCYTKTRCDKGSNSSER